MRLLPTKRQQRQSDVFRVPRVRLSPRSEEESIYFWSPSRYGVRFAPEPFRSELHRLHPQLECTWHPLRERWIVWYQDPTITYALCRGWKLVLVVQTSWGAYVPLDARVFAVLHERSGFQLKNGAQYFDRICREIERETDALARHREADDDAKTSAQWDATLIKNIGHGSKFARHHAGD
jgi:hypothetical protein